MFKINNSLENICFLGDIHGNFEVIKYVINNKKINNSYIIVCGDVGIGFSENYERDKISFLNEKLTESNNIVLAIRGNHDDPKYFTELNPLYGDRFITIPDYTILELCNKKILFIGGAVSVDRTIRKMNGYPLFKNEEIIKDLSLITDTNIDIVVTHSSPYNTFPYVFNNIILEFINIDHELEADIELERSYLTEVFNLLKHNIKYWIHGHYHSREITILEKTKMVSLSINDIYCLYEHND